MSFKKYSWPPGKNLSAYRGEAPLESWLIGIAERSAAAKSMRMAASPPSLAPPACHLARQASPLGKNSPQLPHTQQIRAAGWAVLPSFPGSVNFHLRQAVWDSALTPNAASPPACSHRDCSGASFLSDSLAGLSGHRRPKRGVLPCVRRRPTARQSGRRSQETRSNQGSRGKRLAVRRCERVALWREALRRER